MAMRKVLFCYASTKEVSYQKNTLESANYILVYAESRKEIINKAKSEKPDLIYMDIMTLEERFYQIVVALQSDNETKNIPVIFFSDKHQIANRIWAQLQDARSLRVKFNEDIYGYEK
ncbi:hypothetical protein [Methylomicrobium lacus]|uniref:hypothetical protein n=1 Tax=Methylomicrobium lacus TaxID=136992 RepID=UPI0035A81FC2